MVDCDITVEILKYQVVNEGEDDLNPIYPRMIATPLSARIVYRRIDVSNNRCPQKAEG